MGALCPDSARLENRETAQISQKNVAAGLRPSSTLDFQCTPIADNQTLLETRNQLSKKKPACLMTKALSYRVDDLLVVRSP